MVQVNVILSVLLLLSAYELGLSQMDYSQYDDILQKHVSSEGVVDYTSIRSEDFKSLNRFLNQISSADPTVMNRDDELAFWINAYNAYTLKLIIDHWPVASIRDIEGGNPWDISWIEINDHTYSLNEIEHDIIRQKFKDPRIHFAVNCAAKSCPQLLNTPYLGAKIDAQLEVQTRQFVNNKEYNQLSSNSLKLSRIFDWYKEDFGNLIEFLNKYSRTTIDSGASIRFTTYDWSLND